MVAKVLDAGDRLMINGDTEQEVNEALTAQLAKGSKVVTATVAVGRKWVAACTLAATSDETSDLSLSAQEHSYKSVEDQPEVDDGCVVEKLGLKRIVRGPSERQVRLRIEHLMRFGAELVGEVEQDGDSWIAVLDTGGMDKTFRW
jgi:hypothetical protein